MPEPFDFDEVISQEVEVITRIKWVNNSLVKINSITVDPKNTGQAVVLCDRAHGLSDGESTYITGFGYLIDGKYQIRQHPSTQHRTSAFLIDRPKRLEAGSVRNGVLHQPATYDVYNPKHLAVNGSLGLKQLQYEQEENRKAQAAFQGVAEKAIMLEIKLGELQKELSIDEGDRNAFKEKVIALSTFTQEDLTSRGLKEVVGQLSLKDSKGKALKGKALETAAEKATAKIDAMVTEYRELGASIDIDPEKFAEAFDRRALELRKKEIELLCIMPPGLMDALDNMTRATDVVDGIYAQISKASELLATQKKPEDDSPGEETPPRQ